MNMRMEKVTSLAITIMLLASFAFVALPVHAQTTVVKLIPASADATLIGQEITFAAVVEDVLDLAGIGFQIQWNTTYLDYVGHELTVPVQDYPGPIPPSPYGGLINEPELIVSDTVNAGAGTYDAAASTLGGAPFNGSGTAFWITLAVKLIPFKEDVGYADYIDLPVVFTLDDLADSAAANIPHTVEDGNVRLYTKEFEYPPWPLLQVLPEVIECTGVNATVTADVWLKAKNMTSGAIVDLDPFWDVAGIDVYMNFDPTMIEAVSVSIDPDGWFEGFWYGGGIITVADDINNTAGTVHVAFIGYGNHTPAYGSGRMFEVTFMSLTETDTYPPGTSPVTLENPQAFVGQFVFDSIGGLVDIANPVGTTYNQITKHFLDGEFELISWEDNGDGVLSPSDQFILNDTTTGEYFDYHLDHITGTLNLTLARTTDFTVWATNSIPEAGLANNGLPGRLTAGCVGAAYNGFGVPNWTGNFTTLYPVASVNTITVHALPFTGDEYTYTLVAGVDFIVHADDDLIELLIPIDVPIVNEHWMDGVNNTLNGWPMIGYVANSIQSVHVDKHDGFGRVVSPNAGYGNPPPGDWWYDPDWPWELEGWWALGYFVDPSNWPAGSEWWINYTACSYMTIDYNTDPTSAYVEYDGSYAEFLAVTNPVNTTWNERYPNSWQTYTWENFTDSDTSGDMTAGDLLIAPGNVIYCLEGVATDLITKRKPWIDNYNASNMYFGTKPIISLAGFHHPERSLSPWNNKIWSVSIPHKVENATYTAFAPPLVLTLTPDSGFAATTITGSGFHHNSEITITWNGTQITTVPYPLVTDATGNFTAIVSVPTQNTPGIYNVTATDEGGTTITTTFTVVDMTGPQGESGEPGEPGATGPQGESGEPGEPGTAGPQELLWASLILAIAALCLVLYVLFKKS